jgi:hypothetical protein
MLDNLLARFRMNQLIRTAYIPAVVVLTAVIGCGDTVTHNHYGGSSSGGITGTGRAGTKEYNCENACEGAVSFCNEASEDHLDSLNCYVGQPKCSKLEESEYSLTCIDDCGDDQEMSWNRRHGEFIRLKIERNPLPSEHCEREENNEDYVTCTDMTYDGLIECFTDKNCPEYVVDHMLCHARF